MTELQLYKFIKDNGVEWHWSNDKTDVYIFVHPAEIKEFSELLGVSYFGDGALKCHLTHGGYIAFDMANICEHHGIELSSVFNPSEEP